MNTEPVFLYVEDDLFSRQIMQLLLERVMKFNHVFIFENSQDFMARLEALPRKPDLIFLDIHMQPDDGFTLLAMLRSHNDYKHLRVAAVTASVMNEEVERLNKAGFDGVLAKPIDQTIFPDVVQRILKGERIWNVL
jgi:two-component system, OmpR family, response regulator